MAHHTTTSPSKGQQGVDEDRQNGSRNGMEEQHDANLAQAVDELSLNYRYAGRDKSPFKEDCATNLHQPTEETSLKSYKTSKVVVTNPSLSEQVSNCGDGRRCSEGTDFDRRQAQPTSSVGIQLRQPVQQSEFDLLHLLSMFHTISGVQSATQGQCTSSSTAATQATHDSSHISSLLSGTEASERGTQRLELNMNILPSLNVPRINNTDIPTGLAEQQPSFRTTSTVLSDLSSITRGAEKQPCQEPHQEELRQQIFNGIYNTNLSTSLGTSCQLQPMTSAATYMSSEDNFQNVSVFPLLGHPPMTAQPVGRHAQMWQNNGSAHSGNPAGGAGYGRQISHASSSSSLKSFINNDCLVKKLSWKILHHVALTLQCKYSYATWKDLVEMYGWDYERTHLFENKPHPDGIFFSLLWEPEFQDYSLEKLRKDLFNLPRRDILTDLNRLINEHNDTASGRTTYQNQLN